ncbi:unnamed protein product [Prorocentrum cordatum]|uniref:tRNAHis guanylyltransferase catalytic domain-containing protein n=1 Tax=Prorocentrum cordatum TaxID=2364126 RepID=A0ABN9X771_9DINO|nr:unnamed protein product [Polarella glacialis]
MPRPAGLGARAGGPPAVALEGSHAPCRGAEECWNSSWSDRGRILAGPEIDVERDCRQAPRNGNSGWLPQGHSLRVADARRGSPPPRPSALGAAAALCAGAAPGLAALPGGGAPARSAPGALAHQQLRRWLLLRRDGPGGSDLSLACRDVLGMLRAGETLCVGGLDEGAHELPAIWEPDRAWSELGRLVSEREHPPLLDGSKWVSLRLGGCKFGSLMGRLRARGIVGPGYSTAIGEAMRSCCRAVMDEFKATVGYTHGDEIVFLMSPRSWSSEKGAHSEFMYQGRVQKWVSIAASVATALFNQDLWRIVAAAGLEPEAGLCAHFDCRAGVFETQEEALALLLWRAHNAA